MSSASASSHSRSSLRAAALSRFAPMVNCSIPNSTPATGRTSTAPLRRSRRSNNASASFFETVTAAKAIGSSALRFFNAQRSIQTVGRWILYIERWVFSSIRRVKGAWWPSRSSKPSSPRKWRGRFDSYPLRHSIFDFRLPIFDRSKDTPSLSNRTSNIKHRISGRR